MTPNICAADTNVLVYLHDNSNNTKRAIAQNILADNPKLPAQVISEYLNTTRRILNISKSEILKQTADLFAECDIIPVTAKTLFLASDLSVRY